MPDEAPDRPLPLNDRLRAALLVAMRDRDRDVIAALRAVLGAIDAAETSRRRTDAEIEDIVRTKLADHLTKADWFDYSGELVRAEQLQTAVNVVARLLGDPERHVRTEDSCEIPFEGG